MVELTRRRVLGVALALAMLSSWGLTTAAFDYPEFGEGGYVTPAPCQPAVAPGGAAPLAAIVDDPHPVTFAPALANVTGRPTTGPPGTRCVHG